MFYKKGPLNPNDSVLLVFCAELFYFKLLGSILLLKAGSKTRCDFDFGNLKFSLREKCPNTELFLVGIFLFPD